MKKISIIIPVYNVEKYLNRCVDSVLKQTYKNLEIILVDDGSTDCSGKICDSIKEKDCRVNVIHKQNGGLSSARNAGLDVATGDFIGFIDSDDWVTEDMYEYLLGLFNKYEVEIVSCSYILASDKKQKINNRNVSESLYNRNDALYYYLYSGIFNRRTDYSVCKKLYKKECFKNIRFPEGRLYEDMATNFQILKNCKRYIISTKKCYYYYQNSVSITRKKVNYNHFDLLYAAEQIDKYTENENEKLKKLGKLQILKAYFSLLVKICRCGISDEIEERYIKEKLLIPFKKNIVLFLKEPFSLSMKIIAICIFLNWSFARKILSFF